MREIDTECQAQTGELPKAKVYGVGTGHGKSTFWPDRRAFIKLRRIQRHGSRTAKVEVRRALARGLPSVQALESVQDKRARRRRAKFVASLGAALTGAMSKLQARHEGFRLIQGA